MRPEGRQERKKSRDKREKPPEERLDPGGEEFLSRAKRRNPVIPGKIPLFSRTPFMKAGQARSSLTQQIGNHINLHENFPNKEAIFVVRCTDALCLHSKKGAPLFFGDEPVFTKLARLHVCLRSLPGGGQVNTVAERTLTVDETELSIKIGSPRAEAPGWACDYELGSPVSFSGTAYGEDSLQALVLAVLALQAHLSTPDLQGRVRWLGAPLGSLLPVQDAAEQTSIRPG